MGTPWLRYHKNYGKYALDIEAGTLHEPADRPARADDIEVSDAMREAGVRFLRSCNPRVSDDDAMVAELFRAMLLGAARARSCTTPSACSSSAASHQEDQQRER